MFNQFVYIIFLIVGIILYYLLLVRPWQQRWGATSKEVALSLTGDEVVRHPDFNATRGITIHATPEQIWRWIIQIGSKRAGWYSIDWIDNQRIKSSIVIIPHLQVIEIGQFIPFTPNQKNGMWVADFRRYEYVLWVGKYNKSSWLWYLIPEKDGETRLLTRLRTKYFWKGWFIIYYLLYDIGDIIMMRYCMKGIKYRAEREARKIN